MEQTISNNKLDAEIESNFENFWKAIIMNEDGSVNLEQVKKELFDFSFVMEQVPKVYCAITNDTLSKINYPAEVVISKYEECLNEAIQEAVQQYREDMHLDAPDYND